MWFRTTPLILLVGLAFLHVDRVTVAQEVQFETYRLTPSDPASMDLGVLLAMCDNYIVASTSMTTAELGPTRIGAAYVFEFCAGTWVERAKLSGSPDDWFAGNGGLSVAIDGDVIIVGRSNSNPQGSGSAGRVYVFRRDDNGTPNDGADDVWNQEATLVPLERFDGDAFGGSVSVSGDVIAVSAPGSGLTAVDRAYVFRWDGIAWLEEAVLVGSDTEDADFFGNPVSVRGDTVLVGARGHVGGCSIDGRDCAAGAVYVFVHEDGDWVEHVKRTGPDPETHGIFGRSIGRDESGAIVGASGAAYVWHDGSTLTGGQRLSPTTNTSFSKSVSMSRSAAVVGSMFDSPVSPFSGAAYLFRFDGVAWAMDRKLLQSDELGSANFGFSVAVEGAYAAVGGALNGVVYVYPVAGDRLDLADFAELQRCYGADLSPGCEVFDLAPDARLNLNDYAVFLDLFDGP